MEEEAEEQERDTVQRWSAMATARRIRCELRAAARCQRRRETRSTRQSAITAIHKTQATLAPRQHAGVVSRRMGPIYWCPQRSVRR